MLPVPRSAQLRVWPREPLYLDEDQRDRDGGDRLVRVRPRVRVGVRVRVRVRVRVKVRVKVRVRVRVKVKVRVPAGLRPNTCSPWG